MTEQLSTAVRPSVSVSSTTTGTPQRQHRGAGVAAGVLFIVGTVSGIVSKAVLAEVSDAADPIATASTQQGTVVTGALLILVMGLSLALIPVVLLPVLRPVSEFLAYGYLVMRGAVETACYVVLVTGVLSLAVLAGLEGPGDVGAGLGRLLVDGEAASTVTTLVFCLGATLFYVALFRSGIAPRWLAGWGLVGIPIYALAALLAAYGAVEANSTAQTLLFMPLALQEMVLAIWMIARGFRPAERVSE